MATITISPSSGARRPKKIGDQIKLNPSWAKKNRPAALTFFFFQPCFQIRKKEIPMRKYNIVQAGPKTQLGGAKTGLLSVMYQEGIAESVNGVPKIPTNSQPITEMISLGKSFISFAVCTELAKRAMWVSICDWLTAGEVGGG